MTDQTTDAPAQPGPREPQRHVEVPDRLRSAKGRVPPQLKAAARGAVRRYAVATAGRRVLPDFLIAGSKRGGTTSLWKWLQQHPGVLPMFPAVQQIKSPHYFDINWSRGERWYRSHFPTRAAVARAERHLGYRPVVGEASPYYMFHPLAPERVAATAPEAKVIMLLRDPVERAFSNYRERRGSDAEDLETFAAALDAEEVRLEGEVERLLRDPAYYSFHHDNHSYLARGRYDEQVRRWLEHHDPARLLILRSEDMYADPPGVFAQVEDFLGIPRSDAIRFEHHHLLPNRHWLDRDRRRLVSYYEPHNEALFETLGRRFDWATAGGLDEGPTPAVDGDTPGARSDDPLEGGESHS